MKLNKAQMHQRPTYETLVKDTILEPKDKIALPDRAATILRKTQELTRYDDAEFLDLEKDIVLYCTRLYYTVLYCAELTCIVLYCKELNRTVLYCTDPFPKVQKLGF